MALTEKFFKIKNGIQFDDGTSMTSTNAISGATGPQGPTGPIGLGYEGLTSNSTLTPSAGVNTFTVNKSPSQTAFNTGSYVSAVSTDISTYSFVYGILSAFTGTTLQITADGFGGSAKSSWNISIIGPSGIQGPVSEATIIEYVIGLS